MSKNNAANFSAKNSTNGETQPLARPVPPPNREQSAKPIQPNAFPNGVSPQNARPDAKNGGGSKRERRKRLRRVLFWSVFLGATALATGVPEQVAQSCFWSRARRRSVPVVRRSYYPPVVAAQPIAVARPIYSPPVAVVPQTVAVARPIYPVRTTCPSAPIVAAPAPTAAFVETFSAAPPILPGPVVSEAVVSESISTPPISLCASAASVAPELPPSPVSAPPSVPPTFAETRAGYPSPCSAAAPNPCAAACSAPTTSVETEYREEEQTTFETVWENETRYREKTITRQVPETTTQTETVRVARPVWETVEKETSYDVVRYVPETTNQTRTRTVTRPVVEMRERQIVETVNQPETITTTRRQTRVVNRPITTVQTQYQNVGTVQTQVVENPGRVYNRLTWRRGGDYLDPATGRVRYRLPGLYWTPLEGPAEFQARQVYQNQLVPVQTPITTYRPETIVEDVPVTTQVWRPVQTTRTVVEPTTTYRQETITEQVPVTTYKPITERVVQKTPTQVLKTEFSEEVRQKPITTYKTVTEVVREPYVVRVAKQIPKKTKVWRPIQVYKTVVPGPTTIRPLAETAPQTQARPEPPPATTISATTEFSTSSTISALSPVSPTSSTGKIAPTPPVLSPTTTEKIETFEEKTTTIETIAGNGANAVENARTTADVETIKTIETPNAAASVSSATDPANVPPTLPPKPTTIVKPLK